MTLRLELDKESVVALGVFDFNTRRDTVYPKLVKVLEAGGRRIMRQIQQSRVSGQVLRRRSGHLSASLLAQGELVNGIPGVRMGALRGPALRYVGVQEYGTKGRNPASPYPDITPKNAKTLAAPELGGRAVTGAGVHRYTSVRAYPGNLRFVPFRRGLAVGALYDERDVVPKRGQGFGPVDLSKIKPVYRLYRRVAIKPKGFIRQGVAEGLAGLADAVGVAVRDLALKRSKA